MIKIKNLPIITILIVCTLAYDFIKPEQLQYHTETNTVITVSGVPTSNVASQIVGSISTLATSLTRNY